MWSFLFTLQLSEPGCNSRSRWKLTGANLYCVGKITRTIHWHDVWSSISNKCEHMYVYSWAVACSTLNPIMVFLARFLAGVSLCHLTLLSAAAHYVGEQRGTELCPAHLQKQSCLGNHSAVSIFFCHSKHINIAADEFTFPPVACCSGCVFLRTCCSLFISEVNLLNHV